MSQELDISVHFHEMSRLRNRIVEYIGDRDFEEFKENNMVVDAVVRNFEIIGEATNNLPDEVKERHPEMPWRKMYGLRNVVSHEYFGID